MKAIERVNIKDVRTVEKINLKYKNHHSRLVLEGLSKSRPTTAKSLMRIATISDGIKKGIRARDARLSQIDEELLDI